VSQRHREQELKGLRRWRKKGNTAVAQDETRPHAGEIASRSSLVPPEVVEIGKKRLKNLELVQTKQLERLREINRNWIDRLETEVSLSSELAAGVAAASSIPEAATACQHWARRHLELAVDDATRILVDAQKLAETGVGALANGWQIGRNDGSTKADCRDGVEVPPRSAGSD
jgi:hypothetical protein